LGSKFGLVEVSWAFVTHLKGRIKIREGKERKHSHMIHQARGIAR
jgi:hypothetical protein